jgi:hypothetical protein
MATLATTLHIGVRSIARVVNSLEARGLIVRVGSERKAGNDSRGNYYRLPLPSGVSAYTADTARQSRTARGAVSAKAADMKSEKKVHERAPDAAAPAISLSNLRNEAERYRAAHPSAPETVVAARLREYVKEQGVRVDEAMIDSVVESV